MMVGRRRSTPLSAIREDSAGSGRQEAVVGRRRSTPSYIRQCAGGEESQELAPQRQDPHDAGDDSFFAIVSTAFLSQFCCCSQKVYISQEEKEEALAVARAEAKMEEER